MSEPSESRTVSIVGGETLLGREVRDVLATEAPRWNARLIGSAEEKSSLLTEQEGEAVIMAPLSAAELADSEIVLLAGTPASSRKAFRLLREAGSSPLVVDLTYALEDQPAARLRSPEAEEVPVASGALHVMAHPAATAVALLLRRLHAAGAVRRCVANVFEPASERGQRGLDELQQQTVGLLSFRALPKDVFDAQLAFSLLPRLGAESPTPLEDVEQRIDRHLASLLAGRIPLPSLRLSQAPVFHGYSASLWVEFEEPLPLDAAVAALRSEPIDVRAGDEEPPSNVGVAGQGGVTVGAIELDRNEPRALWLWAAADNFRLLAEGAVRVARGQMEAA